MTAWILYLIGGVLLVGLHAWAAAAAGDASHTVLRIGALALPYLLALFAVRTVAARPVPAVLWAFLVTAASMALYVARPPQVSSEMARYRWDGRVAVAGYNPYEFAPDHPEMAPFRASLGEPPRPERPGYFPPLAEAGFYAMSRLGRDADRDYRILVSALALLSGALLLLVCRPARAPAASVVVFLWHPLLVVETASHARLVAPALCLLLAGTALLVRRHQLSPSGFLGFAALTQPLSAALLPLYARRIPAYRLLVFLLVVFLGTIPFAGAGREIWDTFWNFLAGARWNPGGFLFLERAAALAGHAEWARYGVLLLTAGIVILVTVTDDGSPRALARGAVVLLALPPLAGPFVEPWTGLFMVPFLALIPGSALRLPFLYLSAALALSYVGHPGGTLPSWVPIAEYGPLAPLALLGWWRARGR